MVSKNKFVLELDDENLLIDIALLVDLTIHLNELNVHLQDEPSYQYHASNHNGIPNETETMASSN